MLKEAEKPKELVDTDKQILSLVSLLSDPEACKARIVDMIVCKMFGDSELMDSNVDLTELTMRVADLQLKVLVV